MPQTLRDSCVISRLRVGLGTFVAIDVAAPTRAEGESGIAAAYAAISRVENLMHPTRIGGDLKALSDGALGVPCQIHQWTWTVLDLCKRLNRESRGVFDPCPPGTSVTGPSRGLAGLELLQLHSTPGPAAIPHARLEFDLGGIAKGFAVDRAIDALHAAGCHSGLVNAGGDLAVFGDRDRDVLCRNGRGTCIVKLRNAALACSTVGNESQPAEHRGYYNGTDGAAIVSGSVAITAPSAAIADGLTKCLLAGEDATHTTLLETFGARRITW